jgi:hypothetical protein
MAWKHAPRDSIVRLRLTDCRNARGVRPSPRYADGHQAPTSVTLSWSAVHAGEVLFYEVYRERICSPSKMGCEAPAATGSISATLPAQPKPLLNHTRAQYRHQHRVPPDPFHVGHRRQFVEKGDDFLLIVKRQRC